MCDKYHILLEYRDMCRLYYILAMIPRSRVHYNELKLKCFSAAVENWTECSITTLVVQGSKPDMATVLDQSRSPGSVVMLSC